MIDGNTLIAWGSSPILLLLPGAMSCSEGAFNPDCVRLVFAHAGATT